MGITSHACFVLLIKERKNIYIFMINYYTTGYNVKRNTIKNLSRKLLFTDFTRTKRSRKQPFGGSKKNIDDLSNHGVIILPMF